MKPHERGGVAMIVEEDQEHRDRHEAKQRQEIGDVQHRHVGHQQDRLGSGLVGPPADDQRGGLVAGLAFIGHEDMAFELSHDNFLIKSEEDRQQTLRVVHAINQLPNRQKEIVYLKLYQRLSYEEVSEIMQINYQAARNLFYQAIKSLRELLS